MTSPHHNDNMLRALRKVETGNYEGNYTSHDAAGIKSGKHTASGAYQYVRETWARVGGTKYTRDAYLATPDQQDEIAYADVQTVIKGRNATNIRQLTDAVGAHWHGPEIPGVHPTIAEYQQLLYNAYQGQIGQSPDNEGAVTPINGPNLGNVLGGIDAIGAFFALLTKWETWQRILEVVAGALLIGGAIAIATRNVVPPAVKTAAIAAGV